MVLLPFIQTSQVICVCFGHFAFSAVIYYLYTTNPMNCFKIALEVHSLEVRIDLEVTLEDFFEFVVYDQIFKVNFFTI